MSRRLLRLMAVLFALGLLAAACGNSDDDDSSADDTEEPAEADAAADEAAADEGAGADAAADDAAADDAAEDAPADDAGEDAPADDAAADDAGEDAAADDAVEEPEEADERNTFVAIEGVPGVTDDEIRYAVVGTKANNPLGTCILDCYVTGIQAYFDYRNSEGGVYGRELVIEEIIDDELFLNQVKNLEVIEDDDIFGSFQANLQASGWGDLDEAGVPSYVWNIHATEFADRPSLFGHFAAQCADCTQRGVPYQAFLAGATKTAALGYGVSENSKVCSQAVRDSLEKYSAEIGAEVAYFNDDLAFGLPNGIAPEVTAMIDAGVDFVSGCIDLNGMLTLAQEFERQGYRDQVVMAHPNTYDQDFVAEADGLFEGDYITAQFLPFEAGAGPALDAFLEWTEGGDPISEHTMVGWINADSAYRSLLEAGPEFDRPSVIDAFNQVTDYDAGGLIGPIDWGRQHSAPTEGDPANDYADECFAPVTVVEGAFEMVADPATPWFCWSNDTLDWSEPEQRSFQ